VNIVVEGPPMEHRPILMVITPFKGSEGQTLLFSYIGQMSVSKIIGPHRATIDVVMEEDATSHWRK